MKNKATRLISFVGIFSLTSIAIVMTFRAELSAQQRAPHTTYYVHGRIYTNDPANPWAEAMAVSDGKISCIGKMDHVLLDCGGGQEGVETVQLRGEFVMPGFNDSLISQRWKIRGIRPNSSNAAKASARSSLVLEVARMAFNW